MGKGVYTPDAPMHYFGSPVAFIFGRPVPQGVRGIETLANKQTLGVMVHWRTDSGPHSMEITNWNDDTLDALMVAMRLTCS